MPCVQSSRTALRHHTDRAAQRERSLRHRTQGAVADDGDHNRVIACGRQVPDLFAAANDHAGLKSDSELLRVPVLPQAALPEAPSIAAYGEALSDRRLRG